MKTRLKIVMLYIKIGFLTLCIGPISDIWWIFTGNNFVNKRIKSTTKKIILLEDFILNL